MPWHGVVYAGGIKDKQNNTSLNRVNKQCELYLCYQQI